MPKPFVTHETSQYEPHPDACPCPPCTTYRQQHPQSWAPIRRVFLRSLPILVALTILGLLIVHSAQAREGGIKPIPAPPALLQARAACPDSATISYCRSALRKAYAAIAWQRQQRHSHGPYGVQHALKLASAVYGIPVGQLRRVAHCESRLRPAAINPTSTARGLFQFLDSTWNRAGVPGFSPLDPYANALATARLVVKDGSWREWSCGSHA